VLCLTLLQSLVGSTLVEMDSNNERLRQKEGWFHWVSVTQEGGTESTDTGYSTTSSGPETSILGMPGGEVSPLLSAAPSEASEIILVSGCDSCLWGGSKFKFCFGSLFLIANLDPLIVLFP
jgi:hypothetical protein